jgi:radical SAM domain protein|nr:MAG TPA: Iron-sulfur cluster-binding domain [Caudoviricetes sp.]
MSSNLLKNRVIDISRNDNLSLDTPPTTVKIELTGRCTLDCVFCNHHSMKEKNIRQKLLSREDFNIILQQLLTISSVREVGLFYMGESAIHPLLKDFYKELKKYKYFTYLTTNATTIENIIPAIKYIDSLKVSWNYKNIEDFIWKTRSPANIYDKIISNIYELDRLCQSMGKHLTISTIMDSSKNEYISALKKFDGVDHYWLPLQTQCGNNEVGIGGVSGELDHMVKSIPCWSLFKGIYIDVDLNVRMCCYGHYDEHILGSLKRSSLSEILKSDKVIQIKQKHLQGDIPLECYSCLR